MPTLAFDRATANRWTDQDGRLHVERSVISRTQVDDYLASEIPNWQALGLKAGTLVPLLRPADELAKAAPAYDGLPLLSKHVAVTAAAHRPDLVVGVVMDPVFRDPDLVASLIVWDGDVIRRIEEADEQGAGCGISCGYRYVADMTPGSDGGVRYAGVMRRIVPNHVSLVDSPRVRGAFVGDAAPVQRRTLRDDLLATAPGLALVSIGYPEVNYLRR
jgi:uncharacterized protein